MAVTNEVFERLDPYAVKLVKLNWGYFAKMCEAVSELTTREGYRKAYQRGYRAGQRNPLTPEKE